MNRSIIVAIIALVSMGLGGYLYTQTKQNFAQHGGNVEHPSEISNQSVIQSHRSYSMDITRETSNKAPGQPISFTYTIKNERGEILKDFETVHERKMHLIVVRGDLQHFQHLHPEFNDQSGEWTVEVIFPTDGPYRVFPDFTPAKSVDNPMLLPVTVNSRVEIGDLSKYEQSSSASKAQAVTPDTQSKKTFGDYQVTHTLPTNLTKQQEVTYSLTIERNGQPVTDLQQYLGAMGHSVVLKEGTLDFIHTHAGEVGGHGSTTAIGPKIEFSTTFPESGTYKVFTQFQHQSKVITTDYVIRVN